MKKILIQLHPDFDEALSRLLDRWNHSQSSVRFIGIRPKREHEVQLITKGSILAAESFIVLAQIRAEAGFSSDDEFIGFTEKRLHEPGYNQLFLSGTEGEQSPPKVTTISLDFTRKAFSKDSESKEMIYQILLSNILSVIAMTEGLETHEDTRGCPLDFCNVMTDILIGIKNGFTFCESHIMVIKKKKKEYLLKLTEDIDLVFIFWNYFGITNNLPKRQFSLDGIF